MSPGGLTPLLAFSELCQNHPGEDLIQPVPIVQTKKLRPREAR